MQLGGKDVVWILFCNLEEYVDIFLYENQTFKDPLIPKNKNKNKKSYVSNIGLSYLCV